MNICNLYNPDEGLEPDDDQDDGDENEADDAIAHDDETRRINALDWEER